MFKVEQGVPVVKLAVEDMINGINKSQLETVLGIAEQEAGLPVVMLISVLEPYVKALSQAIEHIEYTYQLVTGVHLAERAVSEACGGLESG